MSAALPAHPLQVTAYAIDSVQQRGRLFAAPGDQVYEGQVIGIYQRQGDLKVWGAGRVERGCVGRGCGGMQAAGAAAGLAAVRARVGGVLVRPITQLARNLALAGQPLQEEGADQHARVGQGRHRGDQRAHPCDPGLRAGVHCG